MLRLPLLLAAAIALPHARGITTGVASPTHATARPAAGTAHAAVGWPHIGMPRFLQRNRKHGSEVEFALMRTRLRDLVQQQEQWYSTNGTYGHSAYRVASLAPRDTAAANHVQVDILFAGKKGWTGVASHPDAPGVSCVIYVGLPESLPLIPRTRAEGNEATREAQPACDSK